MKIMAPPSKSSMHGLLHSVPPTLQQATADPCLCQRLLDIHRQVWVSVFWGHCSFLLGPGAHKVLFVPSKSLFPQSCVSSGGSMMGLMATSSKRAYAIPRSAAPRAPAPVAVHCWPVLLQETLEHSSVSVSEGSLGHTRFVWALWAGGLLHCWHIFYQLSYEGSPYMYIYIYIYTQNIYTAYAVVYTLLVYEVYLYCLNITTIHLQNSFHLVKLKLSFFK